MLLKTESNMRAAVGKQPHASKHPWSYHTCWAFEVDGIGAALERVLAIVHPDHAQEVGFVIKAVQAAMVVGMLHVVGVVLEGHLCQSIGM